jgi:chromosomal replication initiation ATPase DnaA
MNYFIIPGVKRDSIEETCKIWNLPREDIFKNTRKRKIVYPRHMLFYYKLTEEKVRPYIIEEMYGFDNATILHAKENAANLISTDKEFKTKYDLLLKAMGSFDK